MQRPVDAEYRLRAEDGSDRWMDVRAVPLRDDAGGLARWLSTKVDINDRKRLEGSLRSNERRTRALIEETSQILWRAGAIAEWSWAGPQWTAFTGQSAAASRGRGWLEMVHPEDRGSTPAAWAREDGFVIGHRLRQSDGPCRWFVAHAVPVRDDGKPVYAVLDRLLFHAARDTCSPPATTPRPSRRPMPA